MPTITTAAIAFFPALYLGLTFSSLASYRYCYLIGIFFSIALLLFLKYQRYLTVALAGFFFFLGLWSGSSCGPSGAEQLQPYYGQQLRAIGRAEPASIKAGNGYVSFIFRCRSIETAAECINYNERLRVSIKQELLTKLSIAENTDQVKQLEQIVLARDLEIQGMLQPLQGFRVPGAFDSALWNRVNCVGGRLTKASAIGWGEPEPNILERLALLNLQLRQRLSSYLPGQEGAVLSGMLLGGSAFLDEDTRNIFRDNGLAHLLSVSGTHLLLLSSLLLFLLKRLSFVSASLQKPLLIAVLCMYALLCGLHPPVLRALLMSVVLLLGRNNPADTDNRKRNRPHNGQADKGALLSLTAVVLLLFKPLWLLDIGFQLSFAASLGLLYLLPACQRLCFRLLPDSCNWLGDSLAVTLAAQLAVIPVEVGNFHQFSLISLISNLFLLPVLELVAFVGLVGLLADFFLSFGSLFFAVAGFLVRQILLQGELLGSLPYSTVVIGTLPLWCAVLYYALLWCWADLGWVQLLTNRERRCAISGTALLISGILLWQSYGMKPLTIYFLDVGQGDCAVIISPQNKVAVIDTGGLQGFDTGSRIVAPFLKSLGKSSIDLLLLSHYDADHAGGAVGLLKEIQVKQVLLPAGKAEKAEMPLYTALAKQLKIDEIPAELARRGQAFKLGGAALRIVAAAPVSGNEGSTVALLEGAGIRALFTGDLGIEGEAALQKVGACNVLKVGHHGSRHSTGYELLEEVRPKAAVISCGAGNRFGHPQVEVLGRLAAAGILVYRTDMHGSIMFSSGDAEKLSCAVYANNYWQKLP